MRHIFRSFSLLAVLAGVAGLACAKKAQVPDTTELAQPAAASDADVAGGADTGVDVDAPAAEHAAAGTDRGEKARGALDFPVVRFEFDSDNLTEAGRAALDEFAAGWRSSGERLGIVIEGHADERGPEEYNLVLGQKRANTVRRYLGALGAPEESIRTISYGENRPLDTRQTEDAHSTNRRAEVKGTQKK